VGARVGERLYDGYSDACVIIEGIHALNPILSEALPQDRVLKVFVSVSTNINRDGIRILSGRKIRFLRRLVRDSIYRNASAEKTLSMWENVLRGEDKYLYPYKDLANIHFDTFHTFEVGVLGGFAAPLLKAESVKDSDYVRTVTEALAQIPSIPYGLVPESSLIKEFIPGGIYEELY
jgi:uridine kinase